MTSSTDGSTGWRWRVAGAAYTFLVTMAGTTLPTPLYGMYEQRLGFGPLVQTLVFATYALGVILALWLGGQSSDRFGRRPVLLVGLAAAAASAVVFCLADGLPALFLGRVLSGVSAGLFTGTATTALLELAPDRHRRGAGLVATAANMLGLGLGPLLAGVLAVTAPRPLLTPYLVHLALLVPASLATAGQPETVRAPLAERRPWRPLRASVPEQVRPAFVPAAISGFAAFATFGLYTAVEPQFLAQILGVRSLVWAGAVAAAIFACSVLAQVATGRLEARTALPLGCFALAGGSALLAASLLAGSLTLFLTATAVLGAGHGAAFRAGVTAVGRDAPAERRGEVLSALFVLLYVGISLPVVGVGALIRAAGLQTAGVVFAGGIGVVAVAALIVLRRSPAPPRSPQRAAAQQ